MPGRDKQRDDEQAEITAQPKSLGEEIAVQVGHEQGLSVDPEDLGRTWLSDATEQGNFESARGGENEDLWASSASSDEALPGPNFEVDKDVWENTVNLTLQNGEGAISNPFVEDEDSASDDGLHTIADRDSGDIDLTQNSVQEASLFDHEAEELGETEGPHTVITDDGHTHARHPGVQRSAQRTQGALPAAAKSSAPSAKPPAKSSARKSSAPTASGKAASAAKAAPAKSVKTVRPPAKKPTPAKASKPKAARSSAPRAR